MRLPMIQDLAARLCVWTLVVWMLGACSSGTDEPATLRLAVTTTGPSPDLDGYSYSLDGNLPAPLGPNELVVVTGLVAGPHDLVVDGVASNCMLVGGTTRSIGLVQG